MTDLSKFDSRETWLAFRADWRARYKAITADIRARKADIQRLVAKRRADPAVMADQKELYLLQSLQCRLQPVRQEASWMMHELDEAKKRKAEQIAAAREALAA